MKTIDNYIDDGAPLDGEAAAAILDAILYTAQETLRRGAEEERAKGPNPDNKYTLGIMSGLFIAGDLTELVILSGGAWREDAETLEMLDDYERFIHSVTQPGTPWEELGNDREGKAERIQSALQQRQEGGGK